MKMYRICLRIFFVFFDFLKSFFRGKFLEKSSISLLDGVPGHNGPRAPSGAHVVTCGAHAGPCGPMWLPYGIATYGIAILYGWLCHAWPCHIWPYMALPYMSLPCMALPYMALPCMAMTKLGQKPEIMLK